MEKLLFYINLIPLLGFALSGFPSNKKENQLFWIAISSVGLHGIFTLLFLICWISTGCPTAFYEAIVLYKANSAEFSIDFYFDAITAVYAMIAAILTFLVGIFSRYYLHREKGYKRFFNNLLFFYFGLNVVLFSGNFETLFLGWEILGVTSFFLIGFYRDRYLPVKNALKVVSLYRVADISLLLGIWICHHYFSRSVTFPEIREMMLTGVSPISDQALQFLIPAVFLIAALVKSAQLPFSSWLPRAMEGPTTSTAIFYGSLSVHIGVFLLLRTHPFWSDSMLFRAVVLGLGLATSIVATEIARVQSSVKTQIAYSSIAQIGVMFMEVALGWHTLALIHFAGNAFLRTYQLLVSPSVLSYLIHDQFFNFIPPQHRIGEGFAGRIRATVYVLSLKEWNLDSLMYWQLWQPFKQAGKVFTGISARFLFALLLPLFAGGLYFVYHKTALLPEFLHYLPIVFALIGFALILRAFSERNAASTAWMLVLFNQLFLSLSIGFNEQFDYAQVHIFLSGIAVSGVLGYWCLYAMQKRGESTSLQRFHGHSYEYPRLATMFLVASLGLAGFPITPTFIGEDLMLGHIHEDQILLTSLTALNLIFDGLVVFRIYARLFLGPHEKGYHEVAYRSS